MPIEASTKLTTVSVVIPNLNGERWLEGCLESLAAGSRIPAQVIVTDDGSTDSSCAVAERFGVTWVANESHPGTGFAATANRGLRAATGDWILVLNNDTEVAPDAIERLEAAVVRNDGAAMLAPLVLSMRDRSRIDSAGMLLFPDATARPRWHGDARGMRSLDEEDILAPSGAVAVFRRYWLQRVGLFDESLTAYLEDIDLCLRIQRRGGRAVFVPDVVAFHWFSGTVGGFSAVKARLIERNHITVAARHLPLRWLVTMPIWSTIRWGTLFRTALRTRQTHLPEAPARLSHLLWAVLQGLLEGLARLPGALQERRQMRREAVVPPTDWRHLLATHRAQLSDFRTFGAAVSEPTEVSQRPPG